jgi:ribosome maturation factor RimP
MLDEERDRLDRMEVVVEPVVRSHGLELVELEWRGRRPRAILRVFVDKPGGVAIRDCERLSRELGDVLDAEGLVSGPYDLEVSSPGLDRQLRTEREYRWAVGKRVHCWLAGGDERSGRLVGVTEGELVLDRDGERVVVERASVTKARLDADLPWPRQADTG